MGADGKNPAQNPAHYNNVSADGENRAADVANSNLGGAAKDFDNAARNSPNSNLGGAEKISNGAGANSNLNRVVAKNCAAQNQNAPAAAQTTAPADPAPAAAPSPAAFRRATIFAAVVALVCIGLDQGLKLAFLARFEFGVAFWRSDFIDLVLVRNTGVAFSLFASLGGALKFIQLALIALIVAFLWRERRLLTGNALGVGLVLGGGLSNLLDRFAHGFVVDYVAWHKWFEFAIFNAADVLIDIGVALIIIRAFWGKK